MRSFVLIFISCCSIIAGPVIRWDHDNVTNTSFIIRGSQNLTFNWTNWTVVACVNFTNAWEIPKGLPWRFYIVQSSNKFGISAPASKR